MIIVIIFTKEEMGTENSWLALGHTPIMEQNFWEQSSALLILCFSHKMIFPSDLFWAPVRGILLSGAWSCSASLHRIATSLSLLKTPVESVSVTIGRESKSLRMCICKCAINQLHHRFISRCVAWNGSFYYSVTSTSWIKFGHCKHLEFFAM